MKITIVTPTLNRGHLLRTALESVRAQRYPEVEHIVVDGLSTDDTMEMLAQYPEVRVIRERDTGLYDALNKGIDAATGEVIGHLNSDDAYLPGTFMQVAAGFHDPAVDAVSGGAEIQEEGERVRQRFVRHPEIELNFANVTHGNLIPNARFFRRSFYQRVGHYVTNLRVAADREWMFRAVLAHPRQVCVEEVFYRYLWHGESLTFSANPAQEARWREEYLSLAEGYLRRRELPREAHTGARKWHRRESAAAATRALLAGELRQARDYAARGMRQGLAWPITFAHHVGGALLRR